MENIGKNIIIKNEQSEKENYNITNCDSFSSKNRKRINIMNIPYQENEIEEEEFKKKSINSIQICELKKKTFQELLEFWEF